MSASDNTIETADEVVDKPSASTALSPLSPLEKVKAGLIQLATESRSFDVTTPAGEKAARVFRAKCVSLRTAVDDAYEAVNRPLLQTQRDARALRDDVKEQVKALEDPIDQQIKAEEARREAERIRKAEAEARRIATLNERIDGIKGIALRAVGKHSDEISQKIELVAGMTIGDTFHELKPAAEQAQASTLATLRELYASALAQEEDARQFAEQRAELARRQAEQAEADRIERERIAEEQRAQQARIDAERAALEQQQREARVRQEQIEREARLRREEEDRRAAAAREQADREARERREAEELRISNERAALRREQEERDRQEREASEARARAEREDRESEERAQRILAKAEEQRQADMRAEQRRQEEAAAIADKRVRDVAHLLLVALQMLVNEVRAAGANHYAAAISQADAAIALAVGTEPEDSQMITPATEKRASKSRMTRSISRARRDGAT